MTYLTAAVIVIGLLCLLDLVLSLGVIRRLRLHTDHLNRLLTGPARAGAVPVGTAIGDFTVTTTHGERITRESLSGHGAGGSTLVGFFASGCQPCAEQLPAFIAYARSVPGPRRVLAVVDSDGVDQTDYVERLAEVARVVLEGPGEALQTAFGVDGFPMLYLIGEAGVVLAGGRAMAELEPAVAAERAAV